MSLYGHSNISHDSLIRWCQSLSPENLASVDIGGDTVELTDTHKAVLRKQIEAFEGVLAALKPEDDWRNVQGLLSPLFYNALMTMQFELEIIMNA